MSTSLETRLRELAVPVPHDLVSRAKARAATSPPARRPLLRAAAAVAGVCAIAVAVNATAVYFMPRYSQALADSPIGVISAPLLRASGLSADEVTPIDQTVTASGHTLRLVGAYADGVGTTVFLQVDGQPLGAPKDPSSKVLGDRYSVDLELTDQFGRTYQPRGSSGTSVTDFQPLAGPAAAVGGRLTLRATGLQDRSAVSATYTSGLPHVENGPWTYHFTLIQRPVRTLPVPAPVRVGDTTYTFTSLRGSVVLEVKMRISGGALDRERRMTVGLPPDYQVELFDQAGQRQRGSYGMAGGGVINNSWVLNGGGRYRLHLGDPQHGADVWVTVPRP